MTPNEPNKSYLVQYWIPTRSSFEFLLFSSECFLGLLRGELIRVTLPPMERFLQFYAESFFCIIVTTGFQVARCRGFAPIGKPRKLKGMHSVLQERKDDAASRNLSLRLIPYNLLLKKFSKLLSIIVLMLQRFFHVPSPIKIVSSAY